jgi:hypothetical protein
MPTAPRPCSRPPPPSAPWPRWSCARANGHPTLAELPAENDLTLVPLAGGFALLHQRGVFVFDDWRAEPLPLVALCEETRRCVRLLGALREVETRLAARLAAGPLPDASRKPWRSLGILTDLAVQRAHLAGAHYRNAPADLSPEVRRFRAQLIACWGIDKCSEDLQRRLTQMEDAIRTASTLRTQGLVQMLSVYGLPFFIGGGVVSLVGPWIESLPASKGEVALTKLGLYLGLAIVLIGGVRLVQYLWVRAAARLPKSQEPRP